MRTKKWLVIILVLLTVAYCGIAAAVYDHSASITVFYDIRFILKLQQRRKKMSKNFLFLLQTVEKPL